MESEYFTMDQILDAQAVKRLEQMISGSDRIVLTCHVRPDGDAVGSTLGLAHLLSSIGKHCTVIVPDMPPQSLSWLPGFRDIAVYTRHDPYCRRMVAEADLMICCDFNKPERTDHMAELIEGAKCKKVLIDHHQLPLHFTDLEFSCPDMSSTCELAFRIVAALGLYTRMNLESATCLLTGMVTDTRNFSVNTEHPDIYEILMRLIEKGADKKKIVKMAMETRSLASLKLESFALSEKLEVYPAHACALVTLSADELKRYGYEKGDTEGLVNRPLEVKGIVYSVFLREDKDCVKVSARSVDGFPVSDICSDLFGGGGHRQASGAEFKGSLEECRRILIDHLADYDKYLPAKRPKIEIRAIGG